MTNPDELEDACSRVAEMAGWFSDSDDGETLLARSVALEHASDLRLILAANRKMRAALENFVSGIERAPISWETGVCCCGNSVDGHSFGDGHSPVDEGVHFVMSLITEARSALSTKEPGQ